MEELGIYKECGMFDCITLGMWSRAGCAICHHTGAAARVSEKGQGRSDAAWDPLHGRQGWLQVLPPASCRPGRRICCPQQPAWVGSGLCHLHASGLIFATCSVQEVCLGQ